MTTSVPESRKAAGLAAANFALFIAAGSLFTSNIVPVTHHWLFPFHEAALLAQALGFSMRGRFVRTLTLLSLLVILIGVARLETIIESGHLPCFGLTLALGSALHWLLSRRKEGTSWRKFNLAASVTLLSGVFAAGTAVVMKGSAFRP